MNKTIKNISTYSLISAFTGGISFLLLPILTTYLTPEDYGVLSLFNATLRFLAAFITMGMSYVLMLYLFQRKNDFSIYFQTFLRICFFNSIVITLIILFVSFFISSFFGMPKQLAVFLPILALFLVYFEIFVSYFIYKKDIRNYSKLTLFKFFIEIIFVIILVVVIPLNWEGRVSALTFSLIISVLIGFIYFKRINLLQIVNNVSFRYKELIKAGLPLILLNLSIMIMSLSDRYFVESIVGLSDTGLYGIASTIAGIELMIVGAAINVYRPLIYEYMSDLSKNKKYIFSISIQYTLVLSLSSTILIFATKYIFIFMIGDKFFNAASMVYPLIFSLFFWGIYNYFVSFLMYKKLNLIIGTISIFGIVVNLILNYFFINKFSTIGAAYSTLVTYAVICILVIISTIQTKSYAK